MRTIRDLGCGFGVLVLVLGLLAACEVAAPSVANVEQEAITCNSSTRTKTTIDNGSVGADGHVEADLDGDGDLDLAAVWEMGSPSGQNTVRVCKNNGSDTYTCANIASSGSTLAAAAEDITAGDVDDDGEVDLIVVTENQRLIVYWNLNGDIAASSGWTAMAITAATNDQLWMQADFTPGFIWAGGRESAGYFEVPASPRTAGNWSYTSLTTATHIMTLKAIDIDGDGDIDLFLTDRGGSLAGTRYMENIGSGFQNVWISRTSNLGTNRFAHLIDWDNDGNLDVIDGVTDATKANRIVIRLRSTWGTTIESVYGTTPGELVPNPVGVGQYQDVKAFDIDADGNKDLVISYANAAPPLSMLIAMRWVSANTWERKEISGGTEGAKADEISIGADGKFTTTEQSAGLGLIRYDAF